MVNIRFGVIFELNHDYYLSLSKSLHLHCTNISFDIVFV